ncbi:MAG TPA: hypothetical protein VIP70_06855, partial [Nitrososphaeraceae archaeon]
MSYWLPWVLFIGFSKKVCIEEGDSILVTYRNTNSRDVDDVKGFPLDLFPRCHVASDASRFSRFLT